MQWNLMYIISESELIFENISYQLYVASDMKMYL